MAEDTSHGLSAAQRVGLALGPILFFLLLNLDFGPQPETHRLAAVAALMAVWWITEAIPLAATALLPLVLFPLLHIMPSDAAAREYANNSIFLFAGGFFLALAIERAGLHRRIALAIVSLVGESGPRLLAGFMLASALLSMWISNTATAMMMLPIGMSVCSLAEERIGETAPRECHRLGAALMLGIAYGCSIGGIATLVGTPPNIVLQRIFHQQFPGAPEIGFLQWMMLGLPLAAVFLVVAWIVLSHPIFRLRAVPSFGGREVIVRERRALGPMRPEETRVAWVLVLTALLWVTRRGLDLGETLSIPGWGNLLPSLPGLGHVDPTHLHDATVAMLAAVALFLIPSGRGSGDRLLDWQTAEKIPYGILLLFGGGFALAAGFGESGLSQWLSDAYASSPLAEAGPIMVMAQIATGMTFLTELTSNTATTNVVLPLLGSMAAAGEGINPLVLMIPATISASCAFMLPVATPPNAIVFGSGRVRMADMVRAGIALNLIGIALVTITVALLLVPVFGVEVGTLPAEWLPAP